MRKHVRKEKGGSKQGAFSRAHAAWAWKRLTHARDSHWSDKNEDDHLILSPARITISREVRSLQIARIGLSSELKPQSALSQEGMRRVHMHPQSQSLPNPPSGHLDRRRTCCLRLSLLTQHAPPSPAKTGGTTTVSRPGLPSDPGEVSHSSCVSSHAAT